MLRVFAEQLEIEKRQDGVMGVTYEQKLDSYSYLHCGKNI